MPRRASWPRRWHWDDPAFAFELAVLHRGRCWSPRTSSRYSSGRDACAGSAIRIRAIATRCCCRDSMSPHALPRRSRSCVCHPGCASTPMKPIMITSGGTDRRILFVNAAFARLTGFDAQDWIGRSGDLLQAEGPLRMESLLWLDTDADGTEVHWIARMHRRDGTAVLRRSPRSIRIARRTDRRMGARVHQCAVIDRRHEPDGKAQALARPAQVRRAAAPLCNGPPVPA